MTSNGMSLQGSNGLGGFVVVMTLLIGGASVERSSTGVCSASVGGPVRMVNTAAATSANRLTERRTAATMSPPLWSAPTAGSLTGRAQVGWRVVAPTLWAISDLHTGHTGNKPVTESLYPLDAGRLADRRR